MENDTNSSAYNEARFKKAFALALKEGQKRNYKKAILLLEELAATNAEEHPEVYLYLSRSWHAQKFFSRSVYCARLFLNACPDDGSGWFFLGRSLLADGSINKSIFAFRKSLEIQPESIDARTLLGMAFLKARKPSLALQVFEEALSLAPDDSRLNQGYLNALFVEAIRLFKKGESELARQMLTFLINNDIDGVIPRLYLAHALRDLGFFEEAMGQYEAASQFSPEDTALKWYPVAILLEMGQLERASEILSELGESAEEFLQSPDAVKLCIIKNHLEAGDYSSAIQGCREWLKTRGSDSRVHALMGEALRNVGNNEHALNHFRRSYEIDKKNPGPYYGILMVLLSQRNWALLEIELQHSLRAGCDPDIVRYYRILCEANLDRDPKKLLPEIQDEVRKRGGISELLLALARTYFRLGLVELAIGWYKKVIELDEKCEVAFLGYIACCEQISPAEEICEAYFAYFERWSENSELREEFIQYLVSIEHWQSASDQAEILISQGIFTIHERTLALWRRKAGQYRLSAVLYRNLLRKTPDDRALLANLVFCLDRMNESKAALRLMKEANKILTCDADSLFIEGRLHARTGDYNAALAVFRKAIDLYPAKVRGWEEIAKIYEVQGVAEMAQLFRQKARDLQQKKSKRKSF